MSIQDDIMSRAMLEAAVREVGEIIIRKEHWESVTLEHPILCVVRSTDDARVLSLGERPDD